MAKISQRAALTADRVDKLKHILAVANPEGLTAADRNLKITIDELAKSLPYEGYWNGKTLAVAGDSLSTGVFTTTCWGEILANKLNMTLMNYASNNNVRIQTVSAGDTTTGEPICIQYTQMSDAADLIIIAGGGTDWIRSMPLGNPTDRITYSLYGALHVLCLGLQKKYKNKQIVFVIEPAFYLDNGYRSYKNRDSFNELGLTWSTYALAIKEVCAWYGIPVCDMNAESSLFPFDSVLQTEYFGSDGTHPNVKGHTLMANCIYNFINNLKGI